MIKFKLILTNPLKLRSCLLLVTICLFQVTFADTLVDSVPSPRFKVLSYNLRFGELASLEQLASFIKSQKPDVVALQEVDAYTHRERAPKQNGKDFATELGYRSGMFAAYGKTIPYRGGYYGIAILSKYPIAKMERVYLPKTKNGKEQRAVLIADIEYENGKYFTFASTHLDYTNTEERQTQVAAINKLLMNNKYPVIIGGDFNARPNSKEIQEGMKNWQRISALTPTVPADNPRNLIDYIFCRPMSKWKIIDTETYNVQLSDHLPIGVVVEMR